MSIQRGVLRGACLFDRDRHTNTGDALRVQQQMCIIDLKKSSRTIQPRFTHNQIQHAI